MKEKGITDSEGETTTKGEELCRKGTMNRIQVADKQLEEPRRADKWRKTINLLRFISVRTPVHSCMQFDFDLFV